MQDSSNLGKIHAMTINTGRQNRKRLLNSLGFATATNSKAKNNASATGSPIFHRRKLSVTISDNQGEKDDEGDEFFSSKRPRQWSAIGAKRQ